MASPSVVPFHNIRSRFFEGLAPVEVKTITSAAKQRRYFANSVIVNQGHPADHLFLLTSGRLGISMSLPTAGK